MKRIWTDHRARLGATAAVAGAAALMAAGMPATHTPADAPEASPAAVAPEAVERVEPVAVERVEPVVESEVVKSEAVSPAEAVLSTEQGSASYYASSLAGRLTASGIPYDPSAAVAAHRTLPFGTRLRVHNLSNGESMEVTVVDRGPFAKGRILDLSRSAAERLDFIRHGHVQVRIEVLEYGDGRYRG